MSPSHVRYRVMAFLLALSFLTYFDRVCIMRVQTDIQTELRISDEQMGLIFGAFWLAYAIFEIPAGWLGDRFGARIALMRVVLAWSLFTALTGFASGFGSLLAIRFLFGVGEAGAFPNMARVQSSWLSPAARGRAGGWLWLAARWGGAFAPFVFGSLVRWFDWRLAFLAAGVFGVVWCLLFYPWFRNDPAEHRAVNVGELTMIRTGDKDPSLALQACPENREKTGVASLSDKPEAQAKGRVRIPPTSVWRALFTSRSLWAIMLMYVFGSFGWSFFVSWMPKYLERVHNVPFNQSEQLWKQPLLYGGLSCLLGGVVSDSLVRRIGNKRFARAILPVAGCITAAAAVFGARFVHDADSAVVLMCVAGAAYDFGQAANWATIVDVGGLYAGVATGLINLGNIGNVIQPWLGAKLFDHYDWNTLLAALAVAFLLAAAMWLFIDPRRTFYDRVPTC